MSIAPTTGARRAGNARPLDEIWFTRCPVPTATGIAADLGRFEEEFGPDDIVVSSLQDQPGGPLSGQHFEHGLSTLFREGGTSRRCGRARVVRRPGSSG